MARLRRFLLPVAVTLGVGAPPHAAVGAGARSGSDQVLLTPAQALEEIFPDHGPAVVEIFQPGDALRDRVRRAAGAAVPPGPVEIIDVRDGEGRRLGCALVLDEKGKYRPITFMVGVNSDGTVRGVEVMVYREDRGDEVRHGRFLRQYRGKDLDDPIRAPGDIVAITGATISVHSINRGVRRALATAEVLCGEEAPAPIRTRPFDAGR